MSKPKPKRPSSSRPGRIHFTRSLAVLHLKRRLQAQSWPRLQMGLIVALTGAFGLLCSFVLLHAGVASMALRYPLAVVGAYLFFLFLLWLWLRTRAADWFDGVDLPMPSGSGHGGEASVLMHSGGGGDFGGGGASGSFGDALPLAEATGPADVDTGPFEAVGEAAGSVADADELAIPILALVLALGLAFASLFVVYLAPALFAELLFDGVLSFALYRHLRADADRRHWLTTALRRTAWLFVLTAIVLALTGWALSACAPGAHSIGEALHRAGR